MRDPTEPAAAWAQRTSHIVEGSMNILVDVIVLMSAYAALSLACAIALTLFSRVTKRAYDERILTHGW